MTPTLRLSIQTLYEVMAPYPARPVMPASPAYGDAPATWNRDLFSKPLRELTADDLSRFTGKAITTWGGTDDFKHFLPRIFELTAALDAPYEPWIVFGKLECGQWRLWHEHERKSVETYLLALWECLLQDDSEKARQEFPDYFSSIANFYPAFSDLLAIWSRQAGRAATRHLADLVWEEGRNLFDKRFLNGLHKKDTHVAELCGWLLSGNTLKRLETAFYTFEHEKELADRISWAEKLLADQRKNTAGQGGSTHLEGRA